LEAGNGIGAAFFGNLFDEELLIFFFISLIPSKREAKKRKRKKEREKDVDVEIYK
jgi:hypothetical protein